MPDWFPTKWASLFTQPWEGDITLVLPAHLWNLGKSIANPTTNEILSATRQVCVLVCVRALVPGCSCVIASAATTRRNLLTRGHCRPCV
jgi:hypothetical protein